MMKKLKKIIILSLLVVYVLTIFFTIIRFQFAIELCAPISSSLVFFLLIIDLRDMGPHKLSTLCMGLGFLCIAIGDALRFIQHYCFHREPYTLTLRFIYAFPTVFFALNVTIFLLYKLSGRKRDQAHLFVNTFFVSAFGLVFIYKFFVVEAGPVSNLTQLGYLTIIFIAFYVAMMSIHIFYFVGWGKIRRGTLLATAAMLIYEVIDSQYILVEAIGREPNNNYLDLLCTTLIIIMVSGITIQTYKQYSFEFRRIEQTMQSFRFLLAFGISAAVIFSAIILSGNLTGTEASQVTIIFSAYLLMCYLLYIDEVNERQNILLENMVEKKTHDLKAANTKLEMLSSLDLLTGLHNRRFINKYMEHLHEKSAHESVLFVTFCIDLNMFKPVNDTYGHEMGDKVLEEFGNRMQNLPEEYTSFRIGGDEFLIILELKKNNKSKDKEKMEQAAVMLQNLFHTPVRYETYIFHLSASIGASIYPWDSGDVDTLIQYADTAMYSVKHSGCKDGYRFFDESLIHLLSVRHAVNQKLKSAEPEKDFMLYYQPQVNAQTGEIIGMEAFPHLKGDLEKISPADLIPVAEETGFMSRLGIWIVSSALRQVVKWNKKYGMDMHLTVNLSPLQLIDSDYFDALHDLMESLQLSPSILTLDVANSVIMGAASSAKESMKALHDRGYYLSLNDFGGDDINLSYVLSCGFHGIKLSRSLVSGMKADPNVQILLDTILAIAKNMNIVVTAVGIEMEEEADRMKELGIVEMQGYLFGKPEKAEAMEKKLRRASNGKRTR